MKMIVALAANYLKKPRSIIDVSLDSKCASGLLNAGVRYLEETLEEL